MMMAVGMGLTFVPITMLATTNTTDQDAGLASGLFNTSQQVGGALGLAVLSTLAADRTAGLTTPEPIALVEGYQVAFLGGAVVMALGVVLLAVLLRRRDVERIEVDAALAPA